MSLLVVDASITVNASLGEAGFDPLGEHELVAPPLLWSESRSVLHEMLWRGAIDADDAEQARRRLRTAPITRRSPKPLDDTAWVIADELGVAKTYDAEYLALARLLRGRVLTADNRLRRGAARLRLVIGPDEL